MRSKLSYKKNFSFVKKLKKFLKKKNKQLHEPTFDAADIKSLNKCIRSSYVSTIGNEINKFEDLLKKKTKSKYVIATVNGTSAIQLALKYYKINKNDEVLLPSLNFISAANAVLSCNASLNFVEIDSGSMCVCPIKLENYLKKILVKKNNVFYNKYTNKRVKTLILLHIFGHAAQVIEIKRICRNFKINIIEDAAECLGSYYVDNKNKKTHLGTISDIGILSFNGNKIITTGGGGAILTNKKNIHKYLLSIANHGKKKKSKTNFEYNYPGLNLLMPNLNASLGCSQFKKLDKFIKAKRLIFNKYSNLFKDEKNIQIFKEPKHSYSNYWLQVLILSKNLKKYRNKIIKEFNSNGIQVRPAWKLLHKIKFMKNSQSANLSISEDIWSRVITLPSTPGI
jgi:perosamine synthetase